MRKLLSGLLLSGAALLTTTSVMSDTITIDTGNESACPRFVNVIGSVEDTVDICNIAMVRYSNGSYNVMFKSGYFTSISLSPERYNQYILPYLPMASVILEEEGVQ